MNKRGISGIVVAILLVLIAIMAIIILWSALRGLFEADYDTGLLTLSLKIKSASVDENNVVDVLIKRNVGKGNLVKLKFIFENSTYSYSEINETNLKEIEQKKFSFDLTGNITNITKVSIAPIIKTEKGKEILGNIVDVYIIREEISIPQQNPVLEINSLTSDIQVQRNEFFNFIANVSCLQADCGDVEVSLDPATTLTLAYGYDLADLEYKDTAGYYGIQIKWDISSIPASSTINEGKLCMFNELTAGSPDNDLRVWRISNQNWDESIDYTNLNAQIKINQTSVTHSSITASTWDCFNVTFQLKESYEAGEKNFTIRFEDPDYLVTNINSVNWNGAFTGMVIGVGQGTPTYLRLSSREAASNKPYLDISYTFSEPATPKTGLIPTNPGAVPFYTTEANPQTINLNKSQSQVISWNINATGVPADYDFFAYANLSSNPGINARTGIAKITII